MNYNKLKEPLIHIAIALAAFALCLWLTGCTEHTEEPMDCETALALEQAYTLELETYIDEHCASTVQVVGSVTSVNGFGADGVCYLLRHYMTTAADTDDVLGHIDDNVTIDAVWSVCGI